MVVWLISLEHRLYKYQIAEHLKTFGDVEKKQILVAKILVCQNSPTQK